MAKEEKINESCKTIARYADRVGGIDVWIENMKEFYMIGKALIAIEESEAAEAERLKILPAHNAKNDPFNKECLFKEGQRVRLTQPIPDPEDNDHDIQVGDTGTIAIGFAGVKCVYFDKAHNWGMMAKNDIWITDLCEVIE